MCRDWLSSRHDSTADRQRQVISPWVGVHWSIIKFKNWRSCHNFVQLRTCTLWHYKHSLIWHHSPVPDRFLAGLFEGDSGIVCTAIRWLDRVLFIIPCCFSSVGLVVVLLFLSVVPVCSMIVVNVTRLQDGRRGVVVENLVTAEVIEINIQIMWW